MRLILVFLFFASTVSAGPLDWAKHHKRFLLMEGAAIAGAGIDAAGIHHCRHSAGVERCQSHYGSAWATFGIDSAFTTIIMPSLAEACWKDGNTGKFCYPLAYGGTAWQAAWGIHEFRVKPKQEIK